MVPTIYTTRANRTISTNQYSVTEHFKPSNVMAGHNLPGVFFFYDLSPIKVCSVWVPGHLSADCLFSRSSLCRRSSHGRGRVLQSEHAGLGASETVLR